MASNSRQCTRNFYMTNRVNRVTFQATPNIALIKYWGKRDDELILPTGSSVSITLDENLTTRTTVSFSETYTKDELWINNHKVDLNIPEAKERLKQLDVIRKKAGIKTKAKIASINCFPTSAGFASSAAGLAALACSASKAASLNLEGEELSILARIGSGSAARSVYGGFVKWQKGEKPDGSDSTAIQVASSHHWPEIRDIIAVVDAGKKKVSSRAGMKCTVQTSKLYQERLKNWESNCKEVERAILAKDFEKLAELTMKDSNNMHATMLDTCPPIFYMNDNSREVIYAVNELNKQQGKLIAGYTFDAGPNAHVITTAANEKKVAEALRKIKGVKNILISGVGSGPKQLQEGHLIDEKGNVLNATFDAKNKQITMNINKW